MRVKCDDADELALRTQHFSARCIHGTLREARKSPSGEMMHSKLWTDMFALGIPVAEKILRVNESLGGISRLTFQMSVADLPHAKLLRAIELLGTHVAPLVRKALLSSRLGGLVSSNSRAAA